MKNETNVPLTPAAEGGDYASGDKPAQNKRARTIHYGIGAFFLINIVVLYILHFADRGSSSSSEAVAGAFKTEGLSASSATAGEGRAVSFGPDGKLRVGAGTSAYLDVTSLPADKALSNMRLAPMGAGMANAGMVAYTQGAAPSFETVVTTFKGDIKTKKVTIEEATSANTIKGGEVKGLTTLSDSMGAMLYSIKSADGMTITPHAVPFTIADGKVELQQSNMKVLAKSSATTFMTRVSDSAFGAVYYEPYSKEAYYQRVAVGSIGKDGKIALSKDVRFGAANGPTTTTFGSPQSVFTTNDRFVVPWFVDSYAATNENVTINGAPGLCLSTVTFDAKTSNVSVAKAVCQASYQPAYFVTTTKLSPTELAFMFVDRANKFALTVATVEFSEITGKPTFRGAYVFDDATGAYDFGVAFGFYPMPAVQLISNNRLVVAFMNPSNDGKPSVKVLKYNSDLSMRDVSPVLPISNGDFTITTADPKAFGSIVLDMLPLETGVVVSYTGAFSGKQHQRLTFVESYGKPVGVVADVDGSELSIAMSGTVKVDKLTSGQSYYATTDGQLVAASTTTNDEYVLANDNTVVISKDAMVGVAVSDNTLFVSALAN